MAINPATQAMELDAHTAAMFKKILRCLNPAENITLAEWADKYRRLPPEGSAEPGRWHTSRTPYLKQIMESFTEPKIREVIIMSCVQVGKSEFLLNAMGYYIHNEPSTILIIQPTDKTGKDFSKERIATTIRDTPVLRDIIGTEKSRDAKNTVMLKLFPGGYVAIVGANSPSGLASRPIRILLADEVDRWPESAKKEGDPLSIAEKRTSTFPHTKKILKVSTPTIDGISRIQHEYAQGSMEVWKLPCPSCEEYQELSWAMVVIPKDEAENWDKSKEITCRCEVCRQDFNENTWKSGLGKWYATVENHIIKSYRLSALVSPWMSWYKIVEEFYKSKDDTEMLKVWTNTILGEPWLVDGESIDSSELYARREDYGGKVPEGVLVITAAVDVQDNRFEMEVVGWGENEVSWGLDYKIIPGNTSLPENWDRLDQHLLQTYTHADGSAMPISTVCIDSGGHRTSETYRFCKVRENRNVWAIKGMGGTGMSIIHRRSKSTKEKNTIWIIAVDSAKSLLYSRLAEKAPEKAGYCHFPIMPGFRERLYDEEYFLGLTSEVKVTKLVRGRPKTEWQVKKGAINEPLDCRIYNIAAIRILNPNFAELKKRKTGGAAKPKKRRGTVSRGVDV